MRTLVEEIAHLQHLIEYRTYLHHHGEDGPHKHLQAERRLSQMLELEALTHAYERCQTTMSDGNPALRTITRALLNYLYSKEGLAPFC